MAKSRLKDLYVEQVLDMHSACTQSHEATRRLAELATHEDLRDALLAGVEGIERGRDAMAQIALAHEARTGGIHCRAMEGLVAEARADVIDAEFDDDDVRDAAIVAQYQRMAHYAIAGYGTIRALALRLGLTAEADIAQTCLDKSYDGDRRMTEIARGEVNPDAA
jgi:ferritin-like metal-binding protein YciE